MSCEKETEVRSEIGCEEEREDFEKCLDGCGYKHDDMSGNVAFKTLFG